MILMIQETTGTVCIRGVVVVIVIMIVVATTTDTTTSTTMTTPLSPLPCMQLLLHRDPSLTVGKP